MDNSKRRTLSDEEANRILDEILEEDEKENLDDNDEDNVDESKYCAAPCSKEDPVVKFCECMRIAEHSSRFSLRVMEAMRWLQRQEDDLLPTSSVEDIVGYIQVNYRDDGDLYAQVRTALKQVCSQGFVMELLENEYHLIGPNAISMNQVTCLNDRKDCSLPALIKKRKRDDEDNNCNCETTSDEEPELPSKNRRVSANESRTTSRKQERRGRDISTGETQECSCSTTSTDENVNQCVCENEMHKSAKDNSRKQRSVANVVENLDRTINKKGQTGTTHMSLMDSSRRRNNHRRKSTTEIGDSTRTENSILNEKLSDNAENIHDALNEISPSRSKKHRKELKEWIKRCQEKCKEQENRRTTNN
ncbi:PREDICTED: uncharacterized protein LOC108546266 [Eufriesea mexicana]|uniref:uncharacterized protein LOC108546266 n=1 Tax=Eufriesea mexicana TaxID=516756 RepID=UPI00083C4859|nr:PREDICTED: uncharacterized protein LOC108546266 [Eufriesea mexicana]